MFERSRATHTPILAIVVLLATAVPAGAEDPPARGPVMYTVIDPTLHADQLAHATLYGRVESPPEPGNTIELSLVGGVQAWPLDELNQTLRQNGFEPAPDAVGTFGFLIGFGERNFRGALLFGGTGADIHDADGLRGRVSYFMMMLQGGYYVYRDAAFGVSPLLGLGFGPSNVMAETRDPARIPVLRGEVDRLRSGFQASTTIFMLELGVGAQTVIPVFSETGENGVSVMLQAGYALQPLHGDWSVTDGGDGYPGPRADVGGPFARLAIGWGSDSVERHVSIERVRSCRGEGCDLRCDPGFASCDYDPRNGCETPLDTLLDCGACGVRCDVAHGEGACMSGACRVQSCAPSFADCNAQAADGCEADLRVEPRHCGACGAACPEGVPCVEGRCGLPEPASTPP